MVRSASGHLAKRLAIAAWATMHATVHAAARSTGGRSGTVRATAGRFRNGGAWLARHRLPGSADGGAAAAARGRAATTARSPGAAARSTGGRSGTVRATAGRFRNGGAWLARHHSPGGDGGGAAAARGRAATTARSLGAAALRLPRGQLQVAVQRNLAATMPDGVTLLADRYFPADSADSSGRSQPPVILVRSPYGRSGVVGLAYGHFFAQHGFQAVVQSVRGTFGSGGVFDPLGNEREDGLATVAWLKAQPWFGGVFAMYGPSYLGYSQWAIAADAGPELRAMAAQMAASQFHDAAYVGGAFALESTLTWSDLTTRIERPIGGLTAAFTSVRRARRAALSGRPLAELDTLAAGAPVPFFQDLLRNAAADGHYWQRRDHSGSVGSVDVPVSLLGGWYDVFLPLQLRDYAVLRDARRRPQLTIGPWYHADPRQLRAASADALAWFRAHLLGDRSQLRDQPVRLYITGAGEWRDYPDWPVPGMRQERWHLQAWPRPSAQAACGVAAGYVPLRSRAPDTRAQRPHARRQVRA